MPNLRLTQRLIKTLFTGIVILLASPLAGLGAKQVAEWIGLQGIPKNYTSLAGLILIIVLYVIPKSVKYMIAAKKIQKYYPVTNEVIKEHRVFYLDIINKEITHLQQAVGAFRETGMKDDYNYFFDGLQNMLEIKATIICNEELKKDHLKYLNQTFNRGYLMKNM